MVLAFDEEDISRIMADNSLYDILLSLPLSLGMSRNDLHEAAGKARFDFQKIAEGQTIVEEGERCLSLYFLLTGDIQVVTEADDHGYSIEEDISAPEIFQAETIFGLNQRFTHTYIAKTDCSIMRLEKQEILKLSGLFQIFRINFINLISAQSQKLSRRLLRVPPKSLEERIIRFFEFHCLRLGGEKIIRVKMKRIAEEVNDSRLDVSRALNHLQDEGLLQLHRERITIPALEKLLKREFMGSSL